MGEINEELSWLRDMLDRFQKNKDIMDDQRREVLHRNSKMDRELVETNIHHPEEHHCLSALLGPFEERERLLDMQIRVATNRVAELDELLLRREREFCNSSREQQHHMNPLPRSEAARCPENRYDVNPSHDESRVWAYHPSAIVTFGRDNGEWRRNEDPAQCEQRYTPPSRSKYAHLYRDDWNEDNHRHGQREGDPQLRATLPEFRDMWRNERTPCTASSSTHTATGGSANTVWERPHSSHGQMRRSSSSTHTATGGSANTVWERPHSSHGQMTRSISSAGIAAIQRAENEQNAKNQQAAGLRHARRIHFAHQKPDF
jgi:hypothetical protein